MTPRIEPTAFQTDFRDMMMCPKPQYLEIRNRILEIRNELRAIPGTPKRVMDSLSAIAQTFADSFEPR